MSRVPFIQVVKTIGNSMQHNTIDKSVIEKVVIGKNMKQFNVKFDVE